MAHEIPSSWRALIDAFLRDQRAAGAPATSCYTRRQHLEHMARRISADPEAVDTGALLDYMAGQEWMPETRRGRRSTFRAFWAWAVDAGRLERDAARPLPRVKAGQVLVRACPVEVYQDALRRADDRGRLILRLGAEVGLRRAEVAQVHARDLLPDLGGLSLRVHGKGRKERIVPLPSTLAAALREACGNGYAFPGDDHGHLSPRWVGKIATRLLPGEHTMHSLRHQFATRAWREGIEVWVLQDLLGHASADTTRRYVAMDRAAHRAAMDRLAA